MYSYVKESERELSVRKQNELHNYMRIVNWGRQNPVRFAEEIFGTQLIDFQRWVFAESWWRPFVLWLVCRGGSKDTLSAIIDMTKMMLIPNYKIFISCQTAAQAAESFKKLEDIAKQRLPSFKSLTDIFMGEVVIPKTGGDGFIHNYVSGHECKLFNDSGLITLSANLEAIRGKRGSVVLNECGWKDKEALAVLENYANVDSDFFTSTSNKQYMYPQQMPLQLRYMSSASDESFPFYDKYVQFSKKMIAGDNNYFVCDIDANDIIHYSTIDGIKIKPHLNEATINKSIEEDPDAANRELFNMFRKGAGKNAVVSMDCIIRNSVVRRPLLLNDTGKKKFILAYDPARAYDNSMLLVAQLIDDKEKGLYLRLENLISMVDQESKNKTPLPMPKQLEIIRETMLLYNGDNANEWDNIELYIDAGSGGGGVSAVADQLMEDWVGPDGVVHRGVIDKNHKQYQTAIRYYPNAVPVVHLIEPHAFKKIMYGCLEKASRMNLIEFTDYDGKDYIIEGDKNGDYTECVLSFEERIALTQLNLMKNEIINMCRYDSPGGNVTYGLAKDKMNKMHDDRAYTLAMVSYALMQKRRKELIRPTEDIDDIIVSLIHFKSPSINRGRRLSG